MSSHISSFVSTESLVCVQSQILQSSSQNHQDPLTQRSPAPPPPPPAEPCSTRPDAPAGGVLDPVTQGGKDCGTKMKERRGAYTRSLQQPTKLRLFLSQTSGSASAAATAPRSSVAKQQQQPRDPERNGTSGVKTAAFSYASSRLPKPKNH